MNGKIHRAQPRLAALAVAALALAAPLRAWAWDNQGHMASGEAAYAHLAAQDPQAVRAVVALAAALPHRERMDAALTGLTGAARDQMTFAYLARWPDDVRGSAYDHPTWHYRMRIVSPAGAWLPLRNGEADTAYAKALATLRDRRAPARDRAVALAWVAHIVGDMHQPLHAATWWSWRFPKTDRIGSIAYVRRATSVPPVTLHQFWDEAADRPGSDAAGAAALTTELVARYPRAQLNELRARSDAFAIWTDESASLAPHAAYEDGKLAPGVTPQSAAVLNVAYIDQARHLADHRLAVAGFRLADILDAAVR